MARERDESVLYFAYASNMDVEQMRSRLDRPTLTPAGVARLDGWSLAFNKHGKDGTDKANIVPDAQGYVMGCLYRVSDGELAELAQHEAGYAMKSEKVLCGEQAQTVTTFAAAELCTRGCGPSPEYLARIIRGARSLELDADYIEGARLLAGRPAR